MNKKNLTLVLIGLFALLIGTLGKSDAQAWMGTGLVIVGMVNGLFEEDKER